MSNIIEDFNKKRVNNLKSLYNTYLSIINKKYNDELKTINSKRIPFNQKKILTIELNKKYNQLRLSLKTDFEREINNILKNQNNTFVSESQSFNKKALIIGINYVGTSNELNGCINDANSIETFLKQNNFKDIKMLTDNTEIKPTKENILNELKFILENSDKNDLIFIFYSGHGSYTLDTNKDELDGYDELLVPLDFNYIKDDELKSLITTYGKQDTNIFVLFDCCNSGTSLDLKYQILEKLNYDDITENTENSETACNILYISGCKDDQVSLETKINNNVQGLMTWAFLDIMTTNKNKLSWRQLIKQMREKLKNRSYQIPQLSSGKLFNPDSLIVL